MYKTIILAAFFIHNIAFANQRFYVPGSVGVAKFNLKEIKNNDNKHYQSYSDCSNQNALDTNEPNIKGLGSGIGYTFSEDWSIEADYNFYSITKNISQITQEELSSPVRKTYDKSHEDIITYNAWSDDTATTVKNSPKKESNTSSLVSFSIHRLSLQSKLTVLHFHPRWRIYFGLGVTRIARSATKQDKPYSYYAGLYSIGSQWILSKNFILDLSYYSTFWEQTHKNAPCLSFIKLSGNFYL